MRAMQTGARLVAFALAAFATLLACGEVSPVAAPAPAPDASAGTEGGMTPSSACVAGQTLCGALCVFTASDPSHCGACGHACAPFPTGAVECVQGVCADPACASGFADCDDDPTNGCETNVMSSLASDCGACGRTCEGACSAGLCVPLVLTSGLVAPYSIALDGADAFVIDRGNEQAQASTGRLVKVPASGGEAVVLTSGASLPRGLALDADNVYYTQLGEVSSTGGSVLRVGRDGTCGDSPTCPVVLASALRTPWAVAVDADYVYWGERGLFGNDYEDGGLYRIKKDGTGAVENIFSPAKEVVSIALAPTSAFFNASGTVYEVAKSGGVRTTIATANGGLAYVGSALYIGDTGGVSRLTPEDAAPNLLFQGQPATAIVGDDAGTFFYNDGEIFGAKPEGGCPGAGACPTKLLTFLPPGDPSPSPFAIDARYVYAAAPDGRVMRVPR